MKEKKRTEKIKLLYILFISLIWKSKEESKKLKRVGIQLCDSGHNWWWCFSAVNVFTVSHANTFHDSVHKEIQSGNYKLSNRLIISIIKVTFQFLGLSRPPFSRLAWEEKKKKLWKIKWLNWKLYKQIWALA